MSSVNKDEKNDEERAAEYSDKVRKYRQIENDMKAFNDSLQSQFRKQQEEVSNLEHENYKLLEELQMHETLMTKQQKVKNVAQKATDAQELEIQDIIDKIERETVTSKRIDEKVKNMQREIIEQERKHSAAMGGAAGSN